MEGEGEAVVKLQARRDLMEEEGVEVVEPLLFPSVEQEVLEAVAEEALDLLEEEVKVVSEAVAGEVEVEAWLDLGVAQEEVLQVAPAEEMEALA